MSKAESFKPRTMDILETSWLGKGGGFPNIVRYLVISLTSNH